jgi:hypothetical protein
MFILIISVIALSLSYNEVLYKNVLSTEYIL